MAFFENDDVQTAKPKPAKTEPQASAPVQQVIYQQAPKSKLLLAVLIVLSLLLVVGLGILFEVKLLDKGSPDDKTISSVEDIDPKLLVTPDGRKLEVVVFGNKVFEVTRIIYSSDPRLSSVTLTVPGNPPMQAVKLNGETFASGAIRIVDILENGVMLESGGERKLFQPIGASAGPSWISPVTSGSVVIPPKNIDSIPDVPSGQLAVPADPREETELMPDAPSKTSARSVEELLDIRDIPLKRVDYLSIIRQLPKLFEEEFVLQSYYMEGDAQPYGLQIKRLSVDSFFYAHGFNVGDVILNINDEQIRRISELDAMLRSNSFHYELRIDILRGEDYVTYKLYPGANNLSD